MEDCCLSTLSAFLAVTVTLANVEVNVSQESVSVLVICLAWIVSMCMSALSLQPIKGSQHFQLSQTQDGENQEVIGQEV